MTKKLAEVFDITPPHNKDGESQETSTTQWFSHVEITIPDSPTIDDVIKFALLSFKDIVDCDSEPKYAARNMEVAAGFLKIAQDSLIQKKHIEQKDREISIKQKANEDKDKEKESDEPKDEREVIIENIKKGKLTK